MRTIGWLLLLLVSLGWFSSEIHLGESRPSQRDLTDWRRTEDGWEHRTLWLRTLPAPPPTLHPGVVGALQAMLSALALLALTPAGRLREAPVSGVRLGRTGVSRAVRRALPR